MERLMKILSKKHKDKAGFTLIELMIVIIIVGVLAAAAVPIYTGYVKKARVSEAKATIGTIKTSEHVYYAEHSKFWAGGSEISGTSEVKLTSGDFSKLAIDIDYNTWWTFANADFYITPSGDELYTIRAVGHSNVSAIENVEVILTVDSGRWSVAIP